MAAGLAGSRRWASSVISTIRSCWAPWRCWPFCCAGPGRSDGRPRIPAGEGLSACGKVDGFGFRYPDSGFSVPGHTESPEKSYLCGKRIAPWNRRSAISNPSPNIRRCWASKTLHPLVGVIDFSEVQPIYHLRQTFGFYAIFLKEVKCGDMIYGRHYYDYQEGTLVCLAPGQVIGFEDTGEKFQPKGVGAGLPSRPDPRHLAGAQHEASTASSLTRVNEALHLSERERGLVVDCRKIRDELGRAIDRHSRRLIAIQIEMLL